MECKCGLNAHKMTQAETLSLRPIEYCDEIEVRDSFYADGYFEESRPVGMVDARCESCFNYFVAARDGMLATPNPLIDEAKGVVSK